MFQEILSNVKKSYCEVIFGPFYRIIHKNCSMKFICRTIYKFHININTYITINNRNVLKSLETQKSFEFRGFSMI